MKGSTRDRFEFRITFAHGAAMIFDRISRLAPIPLFWLSLAVFAISALSAKAVGLLRNPDIEHGFTVLATPYCKPPDSARAA